MQIQRWNLHVSFPVFTFNSVSPSFIPSLQQQRGVINGVVLKGGEGGSHTEIERCAKRT